MSSIKNCLLITNLSTKNARVNVALPMYRVDLSIEPQAPGATLSIFFVLVALHGLFLFIFGRFKKQYNF